MKLREISRSTSLPDAPEKSLDERLASLERGLEHLKTGLGLLGLVPCSQCGVFYRRADKGALFHCDEFVCAKCVPLWWLHRSPELNATDRQKAERELRRWLVSYHHAEMIFRPANLPEHFLMKLVTGCEECDGSGKNRTGGRCHRCDGRGTVWVVVRAPDFAPASD
jgi:hypothetical protein